MKKLILFLLLFAGFCYGANPAWHVESLTTATTVAASTTNTTAQTAYSFSNDEIPQTGTISFSCSGSAATTNSTGSIIVYISRSVDGINYDTGSLSNLKLTMTSLGNATNQVSELFYLYGVRSIRVSRIENPFLGPISNIVINANFQVLK